MRRCNWLIAGRVSSPWRRRRGAHRNEDAFLAAKDTRQKGERGMLKFIGGTIGIVFLIGLLVVVGLLALIF